MAREAFTATTGVTPTFGRAPEPNGSLTALAAAITAAIALAPSVTALAAAIATAVADGASPTQGHVNAINSAYGTFATALTAYNVAVAALSTTTSAAGVSADLTVLVNLATITSTNKFRCAMRGLLSLIEGQGMLTP